MLHWAHSDYVCRYARCNNTPAHESLNAKLAALHGAEAAMITGSGMAAITTTLLSFVKACAGVLPSRWFRQAAPPRLLQ